MNWCCGFNLFGYAIKLVKMSILAISCFKWLIEVIDVGVSWIKLFKVNMKLKWLGMSGLSILDKFGANGIEKGFENGVLRTKTQKIRFSHLSGWHDWAPGWYKLCQTFWLGEHDHSSSQHDRVPPYG